MQLQILYILEEKIDLGIPIGEFFDLMIGTRYVPNLIKRLSYLNILLTKSVSVRVASLPWDSAKDGCPSMSA